MGLICRSYWAGTGLPNVYFVVHHRGSNNTSCAHSYQSSDKYQELLKRNQKFSTGVSQPTKETRSSSDPNKFEVNSMGDCVFDIFPGEPTFAHSNDSGRVIVLMERV